MTPLDQAHRQMEENPDQPAPRLRFYERLVATELFTVLDAIPEGDSISPRTFSVEAQNYVLVFDLAERLVEFTSARTPFAAMPGRDLVALLAGQGIGLGVNLGLASSAILIPPDAVEWLQGLLANEATGTSDVPRGFHRPVLANDDLVAAIGRKLAVMVGLANSAHLVGVTYENGRRGLLLGFIGARLQARSALTAAVNEVISFYGREATVDVGFFDGSERTCERMQDVGIRIDIPEPAGGWPD